MKKRRGGGERGERGGEKKREGREKKRREENNKSLTMNSLFRSRGGTQHNISFEIAIRCTRNTYTAPLLITIPTFLNKLRVPSIMF